MPETPSKRPRLDDRSDKDMAIDSEFGGGTGGPPDSDLITRLTRWLTEEITFYSTNNGESGGLGMQIHEIWKKNYLDGKIRAQACYIAFASVAANAPMVGTQPQDVFPEVIFELNATIEGNQVHIKEPTRPKNDVVSWASAAHMLIDLWRPASSTTLISACIY